MAGPRASDRLVFGLTQLGARLWIAPICQSRMPALATATFAFGSLSLSFYISLDLVLKRVVLVCP